MQGHVIRVTTADGARLSLKRRGRESGPPVLLIHGLAMNADIWNFPDVRGPDYHYRSLASVLFDAGFDVWLLNLRGHGAPHMLSEPPAGQSDWCVDHFILFDLPAAVDLVRTATGRRPFLLGASMGAIVLAGYLQGARFGAAIPSSDLRATADIRGARDVPIVADVELAQRRAREIAGAVFVEFPAALRWPRSLYGADGRLNWQQLMDRTAAADGNYPFELLARSAWMRAILDAVGVVPLTWLRPTPIGAALKNALPPKLRAVTERMEHGAAAALLRVSALITGPSNDRVEVILHGWRHVVDHVKAGVMQQFAKCVRQGNIVSVLGTPDHVYSDHYALVEAPTLVLAGGRDRIAHPEVTRAAFYERITADDKSYLLFEELNHGDFEAAPIACELVYSQILAWMQSRVRD